MFIPPRSYIPFFFSLKNRPEETLRPKAGIFKPPTLGRYLHTHADYSEEPNDEIIFFFPVWIMSTSYYDRATGRFLLKIQTLYMEEVEISD